jgi:Ca2+/H+ antiporter, TMEM165/GDT1 family
MEALLVSAAVVALAEFGDKTQMFALVLAARFRRPVPILLGILCATLANHALAAAVGSWIAATLGPQLLRFILGAAFIAMAVWTLAARPDESRVGGPEAIGAVQAGGAAQATGATEATEANVARVGPLAPQLVSKLGVFGTALVGVFVLEMGDKTQIATLTLAARYHALLPVLAGSTAGMLAADAVAVLLGEVAARRLPLRLLRAIAAGIFLLIGALVLL